MTEQAESQPAAADLDRLRYLATEPNAQLLPVERECLANAAAEIARLRAELAAREVATDEAIRAAAGAAIDAFPGKLHSEQIDLVLAAVAPGIRAAERERCARVADASARKHHSSWADWSMLPNEAAVKAREQEARAIAATIRAGSGDGE